MKGHSYPVPSTLGLEHERKIFISLAKCAYFVYFYYWTHTYSQKIYLLLLLEKVCSIFLPDLILLHSKKTSNSWQLELQKTNTCSVAQLCLTLCDTMPIWVSISLSRRSSWPWDQTYISCVSCISSWILYHCTWEALSEDQILSYLLILLLLSTVHKMKLKICTLQMGNS